MAMLEVRDLRKSFYTYAKPGLQAGIFHKPGARKVVSQLDVLKGVDLTVNKGDVVMVLEAIKMKNDLHASRDGVVESVDVAQTDQVKYGQVLLRFAKD